LLGLIGFDFLSCFYGEKNDELGGWFSTVIVCHSGMDLHYHPLVSAISFVFRAECNVCSTIPLSSKIVMTAFPVKKHKKQGFFMFPTGNPLHREYIATIIIYYTKDYIIYFTWFIIIYIYYVIFYHIYILI
jgi:hypothetical protein